MCIRDRDLLVNHFNLSELINLSFDLGIDAENLAGQTKEDKARELISYCARRGTLPGLIERCEQLRPNVAWEIVRSDPLGKEQRSSDELAQFITTRILASKTTLQYSKTRKKLYVDNLKLRDIVDGDPELNTSIQLYRQLPKHNVGGYLNEIQKQIVKLENQLLSLRAANNDFGLQPPYENSRRLLETEEQLRKYKLALEALSGDTNNV